jgi:hypothetical protein
LGSILGLPIEQVPDPTLVEYAREGDWLPRYNERLANLGYRLEELPRSLCPPRNRQLWIAGLRDTPDNHVVVARGAFVIHDPAGELKGSLPTDRLIAGFTLARTHQVIPNLSLHGSGMAVVRT